MKTTPLHEIHVAFRAKLTEFAGWHMPVQYVGVLAEYEAVRTRAGLFDVSHMGRIEVVGEEAVPFLQWITTNDVNTVDILHSQYSLICNPQGGIKDDIFLYRLGQSSFLLCVNASNREKIVNWLHTQQRQRSYAVHIHDRSEELAQLAVQGPQSLAVLQHLVGQELSSLKPRRCIETTCDHIPLLISRTGYTGERGYELYMPAQHAQAVWDLLIRKGSAQGLQPAGLGARDLLRLEMGYFLYGNELTEETTPIEAGARSLVCFDKGPFVGREALCLQVQHGPSRQLVPFILLEKGVPRHGMVLYRNNQIIGQVTSGNFSPALHQGIGLGYVTPDVAQVGALFEVDVRSRRIPARVVTAPFYTRKAPPSPTSARTSDGGSPSS
ncbi:MAG: glycine cleavage system aminomethyltransferase GcvT [Nitrospirae bacterium]|nr:MAG: glycine cleavage system aminomethyltransferase GcvT [Nitrospirota bacterium]